MAAETSLTGFAGLRVAGFESRLSEQMAQLIERHGGQPLVVPSMREIPLDRHPAVLDFGARLLAGELQMTILLTGVGTRFMLEVLKSRWTRDQIIAALDDTILVVRGPKPAGVLRELGLKPAVAVPEPNTWKDVIAALDALDRPLQGMKIAVQEYGVSNAAFLKALHERGAEVLRVTVYRWALPEDVTPLIDAIRAITRGELQVALFTNAVQVDHVLQVAETIGAKDDLRRALGRMVVSAIGPVVAERLRDHGLPMDFQPTHPKMGIHVKETSERARELLLGKASAD
ncbi:MAG: uroporphyrinogen-III synthase [Nitrospirae bacterium]|nr:MAG: uroporphyrinogen-III synthase [Nitrospirota bacterium]